MKRILLTYGIAMLCIAIHAQNSYYYYYRGEKQHFSIYTQSAFLSLKEPSIPENIKRQGITTTKLQSDRLREKQNQEGSNRYYTELRFEEKLSEEQYLEVLADIKRSNEDVIISPYLKGMRGDKVGLSNFFYVKLKKESDIALLTEMAKKTEAVIVEQDQFMPLWFVLKTTSRSTLNAMESTACFYESGLFQVAEPDLMVSDLLQCVNDQYWVLQWGLSNTGQDGGTAGIDIKACNAWPLSKGSNIKVAVIDSGIDLDHPDLAANMHPVSYDAVTGTSPSIVRENHGTSCAGIIGAIQNNSIGISGVAPNCKLISISGEFNMSYTDSVHNANLSYKLARGINWAWQNGADVINNSWGNMAHQQTDYIANAINNAIVNGRGGKGCVVVASSGNDGDNFVRHPANLSDVLAVGAIDKNGQRMISSQYGSALNVVAPGDQITMLFGEDGYHTDGGTSYACPHVSGVAALMLSVNPDLRYYEVKDIIESTAQKVRAGTGSGFYNYQTYAAHPNGTWHEQMGYGLVNAYAAVQAAVPPCINSTYTNPLVTSNTIVTGCSNLTAQNVTVTSGARLKLNAPGEITITGPFEVALGSELEIK